VEAGAKAIEISVERRGGTLRLVVQDDGPGLSQEEAERAFDPFFTTKSSGSGLGLAITRQVMEDHGGSVELLPGAPTRILLSIPLHGA
ncbi:MAG: signal transduction histidine kinase, partial [Cognaticolwellia sp.]